MTKNWLDDFEEAVDAFFARATNADIDTLLERADAAYYDTITTPVFRMQVSQQLVAAGVAHSRSDGVRSWCEPSEAVFASKPLFEEVALSATSSAFRPLPAWN